MTELFAYKNLVLRTEEIDCLIYNSYTTENINLKQRCIYLMEI